MAGSSVDEAVGPGGPFLRIWYIAPIEALAEEAIDGDVVKRMRALGYR